MKKFLKAFLILCVMILAGLYLAFLFVLPNVIDLNQYKGELQKIAKEQGGVELNLQNLELVTRPNLHAGVQTGNVSVILPDNSTLFNTSNINLRISLPQLLLLKVKVFADIDNPVVNLDIANGKQFKIVSHIENLLNKNRDTLEETKENVQTSQPAGINPEWIKIFAKVNLNNYKIMVDDLKTNHSLKLEGENMTLGYFNNKIAKIKTNARLYSDGENMINANIDINSFLPKFEPADEEEDDAVEVKIPFVNPVLVYRDYNLKANIDSKIKIRQKNDKIKSWGYFNIENLTANLSGYQLPESYIKVKSRGSNILTDTNLYFAKNQNLQILGSFDYINPKMDLSILSKKIYFNDVILLSKAILDTLRIKNDFASLKGEGYFVANADIKTNFKKWNSNGKILVNNGKITSNRLGLVLDKMNILVNLDNNVLDIPHSSANINGKSLNIKGKIDEKSYTDIDINIEKLPLTELYRVFAPIDIKKQIHLLSGDLTMKAKIKGKLKEAVANLKMTISDISVADPAKTYILSDKKTDIEFFDNFKSGLIKNEALKIYLPMSKSTISAPLSMVNIDTKNITIPKSLINVNDSSVLMFSGDIANYQKNPEINMVSTGYLYAKDIRKFAGKDVEGFIDAKGKLPVQFSLNGNDRKQSLNLEVSSNAENYITPVHLNSVAGQNTVLKAIVNLRNNHIKIKDTGIYTVSKTVDEEGSEHIKYSPVIDINGTIVGDYINKITINIPKETDGVIYAFKNSKFTLNPAKIHIYGDTASPKFRGSASITNLSIPELFTKMNKGEVHFKDIYMNFILSGLDLNGSDMNISGDLSLLPSPLISLSNLEINSKFLDADKIMKVSDAAMKVMPPSENTEPADIPVEIHNGYINFKKIKSGTITLNNTTSKIRLRNNIFVLRDLLTHMCDGKVQGRIAMNLLTGFMKINVKGENLNTEKLLFEAASMKDALSGTTSFETNISLSGTTYEEQVKSLLGKVKFVIKDGQFGPFGRLENMILAENIRESEFFKSTIGRALEPLVTIDTTHYSTLSGELDFKDGITTINSINSSGNILALNIFGKFNLLTNMADMKVRSRLASDVSDMLGPISAINPINLVKNTPGLNVVMAKSFSIFCETVTPEEMENIPDFAKKHSDTNATKFQIVLRGDVNKPLTLVKSFKWLATQEQMDKAEHFAEEFIEQAELEAQEQAKHQSKFKGKKK